MSPELDLLFQMMLVLALRKSARIPTPEDPPDDAWERETDEFCYRFARTQEAEVPSPEVASALIPRLRYARVFAAHVESLVEQKYPGAEESVIERVLLEELLVLMWREVIRPKWIRGELPD